MRTTWTMTFFTDDDHQELTLTANSFAEALQNGSDMAEDRFGTQGFEVVGLTVANSNMIPNGWS